MSTYKSLLVVIAVGALTLGIAGFAQDEDEEQETQVPAVPANALNPEPLQAALNNLQAEIGELQALTNLTEEQVILINIAQVKGQPMDGAQGSEAAKGEQIRQALLENDFVMRALALQYVASENVVGVNVRDDGQVWVYHQQEQVLSPEEQVVQDTALLAAFAPSLDSLVRVLTDGLETEVEQLEALEEISPENIQLVDLQQLELELTQAGEQAAGAEGADNTIDTLDKLIEENLEQINQLNQTLANNDPVSQALEQQSLGIENVVAINVTDAGQVAVFYEMAPEPDPEQAPEAPDPEETEDEPEGGAETGGGN